MTARIKIPCRFAAESAELPIPVSRLPMRELTSQLYAIHSLIEDAVLTGNWQAVFAAREDLQLVLRQVEEA